jgi:hypothetical protein
MSTAADAYGFGWWGSPKRGVAILPPVESPDHAPSPVGKPRIVPYYTTNCDRPTDCHKKHKKLTAALPFFCASLCFPPTFRRIIVLPD